MLSLLVWSAVALGAAAAPIGGGAQAAHGEPLAMLEAAGADEAPVVPVRPSNATAAVEYENLTVVAFETPGTSHQVKCLRNWVHAMQAADRRTRYKLHVEQLNLNVTVETGAYAGYGSDAFRRIFRQRADKLRAMARERLQVGDRAPVLMTGLDVVPIQPYSRLLPSLRHADLVAMREPYGSGSGFVNWDFVLFRPVEAVVAFLDDLHGNMSSPELWSDQHVANRLLWGWAATSEISHVPGSTLPSVRSVRPSLRWRTFGADEVRGFDPADIRPGVTVAFHANGPTNTGGTKQEKILRVVRGHPATILLGPRACVW